MESIEKLMEIRKKNPRSWEKIAKEIGISYPTLLKIRNGKKSDLITEYKIKNYLEKNK